MNRLGHNKISMRTKDNAHRTQDITDKRDAPTTSVAGKPRTEALKKRDPLMTWEVTIWPDLLDQCTGMGSLMLWCGMP